MRTLLRIVAFGLAHTVVSLLAFATGFVLGMECFDTGAPPSWAEQALGAGVAVLQFPLVHLSLAVVPHRALPGLWGHLPTLANGLLWAAVGVWAWDRWRRRTAEQGRAGTVDRQGVPRSAGPTPLEPDGVDIVV